MNTYFDNFESYTCAIEDATSFEVMIVQSNGDVITSSAIPIATLDTTMRVINEALFGNDAITIWNKDRTQIVVCPPGHARRITVTLRK